MADRIHPEERHDWRRDRHGLDRPRRQFPGIRYTLLLVAIVWCGEQAFRTMEYVQQRKAAIEGGQ